MFEGSIGRLLDELLRHVLTNDHPRDAAREGVTGFLELAAALKANAARDRHPRPQTTILERRDTAVRSASRRIASVSVQ